MSPGLWYKIRRENYLRQYYLLNHNFLIEPVCASEVDEGIFLGYMGA